MTKNEVVLMFMGYVFKKDKYHHPDGQYTNESGNDYFFSASLFVDEIKFDSDRNWLHEAWVKFRDLKFDAIHIQVAHSEYIHNISIKLAFDSITEAFDELVKGIEWYNSLKTS